MKQAHETGEGGSLERCGRNGVLHAGGGILGGVAVLAIFGIGCGDRARLRPGTGGIRVRLNGARDGLHSTVSLRVEYRAESAPAIVRETTTREALIMDLMPQSYEVVAYADDGRGGFYRTWAGNGRVRVEAGQVTDVDVELATGIAVTGRVFDAATNQPLGHVNVTTPPHLGSATWPVTLPGLWAETRQDGAFAIGGVEPRIPTTPGNPTEPHERAWLEFAKDGYVTQRVVLEPPDSGPPRHMDVRLQPGVTPHL